ncbi:MAG: adenosine deaminase family protein [Eubacterium sp.]|nr:adenosine deaminase family protein [Eubacterium sp.]
MIGDQYLCELHLHLDGSLPAETIKYLAEQEEISLDSLISSDNKSEPMSTEILKPYLSVSSDCRDLNEYLTKFQIPLKLLQTEDAIYDAVKAVGHAEEELGVDYVELRFAPQLHLEKGLSQRQVIEAAADSAVYFNADHSTKIRLILCCMRGADNHEANLETVRLAAEFIHEKHDEYADSAYKKVFVPSAKGRTLPVIAGIDLAGAEALYPTENFADLFLLARELDIPFTIHAGEAAGPDSIWTALNFGARRIGHGIAAIQDDKLMRYLADNDIIVECCPTSNLNTHAVDSITEHPVREFLKHGIKVTISSDNTTVSNTNILHEFELLENAGLTAEEKDQLIKNATDGWL